MCTRKGPPRTTIESSSLSLVHTAAPISHRPMYNPVWVSQLLWTLNPQPSTLNPQPQPPHPKPQI